MSLRRSRKQKAAKRVAQLWAGAKVVQAAKGAAKLWAGSKAAKTAGKAAKSGGKRGRLVAGALGIAVIAAVIRKRKSSAREAEVDYGPPNESVPSHETLAPSQEAAGQTA
jgi:hypothetical protein